MSTSLDPKVKPQSRARRQITSSRRGIVIVLIAVVIWSTTPVFIDQLHSVYRLTPIQISTWRALLVTIILSCYLIVRRPRVFKLQKNEIGYYILYGVIGISLFNLAFNTSVAINKASVATSLMFCAPVFVALGSWWVFREQLKWTQFLAILINLLGCALVGSVTELIAGTAGNLKGLLIGLSCGVCFAAYTLLGRGAARTQRLNPIIILFYTYLFGTLALLCWGLISQGTQGIFISLDVTGWALLITLSVGPTLFGYLLFTVSLQYLSAAVASIFHTLEPVMTAILALLFLGRTMSLLQWLGLGLIMASVITMQATTLSSSKSAIEENRQATSIETDISPVSIDVELPVDNV